MKSLFIALILMVSVAEAAIVHINDGQDNPFYDWHDLVSINQTREYRNNQPGCINKYNQFAKFLIPKAQKALGADIKIIGHTFCGIGDLSQGSYDLERFLSYCIDLEINGKETTGSLFFMTKGEMFCSYEELLIDRTVEVYIHLQ